MTTYQEINAAANRTPPYEMPPNRAEAIKDLRNVGILAVQRNDRKCGYYDLYFINEQFATVSCAEIYNRWYVIDLYANHVAKQATMKIVKDNVGSGI